MLSLRPASSSDARFVWECRSDPTALAMSGSTSEISYPDHARWFSQHSSEFQVGLTSDGVPVGYGRLANGGVISVAVYPMLRRLGFGWQIINAISKASPGPITAWIRPENTLSQRAFAFAGYEQVEPLTSSGTILQRWEYRP